jgi:xylose isomerase
MLGSIDANQGDMLLGWDTDEFPFNCTRRRCAMYEVLKSGGLTGGLTLMRRTAGPLTTPMRYVRAFILGMDTFALGLLKAAALIEDDELIRYRGALRELPRGHRCAHCKR